MITLSTTKTLALLLSLIAIGTCQEIGVEICACSPRSFEFTLDFSLFCSPVNITTGGAVTATSCLTGPFGDTVAQDLIPVSVQSIDILELNQNLQIIVQENIAGSFGDGDTFQYTSIAALPGEIVDPEDLPRAIQLDINGVNQFDEPIINVYIIIYTNSCGEYPVLIEGQTAGWTIFSGLGRPSAELCPISQTDAQTAAPVPKPTNPPEPLSTDAPMSEAADTPMITPTPVPTPIMSMSMSMSMSMDMDIDMVDLELALAEEEYDQELHTSEFGVVTKRTNAAYSKTAMTKAEKQSKRSKSYAGM